MVQNLPPAEVYEKEFTYMPWGKLIGEIQKYIVENAPRSAKLLDLLCGPGYLLGKLQKARPDVSFTGVDIEPEFTDHARKLYPKINFETADVLGWESKDLFNVVVCTAGVHHVPYDKQELLLKEIARSLSPDGFAIIGDPYIDDYSTEQERQLAGAKLGYEYLAYTINAGASSDVIKAAVDVLSNDVLLVEYKTSVSKMKTMLEKVFSQVEMYKTWPTEKSEYGDYYFILRK